MCGRSRSTLHRNQVAAVARVPPERNAASYEPSYNLSPGHDAPVVIRGEDGQREAHAMRWGLVPSWTKAGTKPDHFRMFNARSETLAEKSVFSRLLALRRCAVYFEGFFEWHKKAGSKKQPYYIHFDSAVHAGTKGGSEPGGSEAADDSLEGEDVMPMAGLYDVWRNGDDGTTLRTFTVLTTDSSKRLNWLHDRMPVLLRTQEDVDAWLDEKVDLRMVNRLSKPYDGEDLVWHEVTPRMGKPSFQGPECCKPLKKGPGITAFFKKPGGGGKASSDSAAAQAPPDRAAAVSKPDKTSAPSSSSAEHAERLKAEADAATLGSTDAAATVAVKSEPDDAAAANPEPRPDSKPGAAAASDQMDSAAQDAPANAPALPLNADEDAGVVERQKPDGQPGSSVSSQPPKEQAIMLPKSGQKRAAGGMPEGAKTRAKREKKGDAATPVPKGQKTLNSFFRK